MAKFNENARAGLDPEFGRGQSLWIRKVGDTKHPINRQLRTVGKGAILRRGTGADGIIVRRALYGHSRSGHHLRGHAILGLYAGGTVRVRTEYGGGYQAGLTLLGGMTFGRIAVEHALLGDKKRS